MKNNGNAEMERSCCNAHLLYKTWTAKNCLKWKAVVVPLKRSVQGKILCLVRIVHLRLIDVATWLVCSLLHFVFAFGSTLL